MKFNGVEITQQSIDACRQWFANNADACYQEAKDGKAPLASHYPLELYRQKMQERKEASLAGEYDHTSAFMQRAYYIQTGECVALLP